MIQELISFKCHAKNTVYSKFERYAYIQTP